MDRAKGFAKGGWRPGANTPSYQKDSRDTKTRLKGVVGRGNQHAALDAAQDHQSAPLSSLQDPANFAPPPKHKAYYGDAATGSRPAPPVPSRPPAEEETKQPQAPQVPYRSNTTGLDAANMPLPPRHVGLGERASPPVPGGRPSPPVPAQRPTPPVPARSGSGAPNNGAGAPRLPPRLPPRQNSHPDMYAPDPPPTYGEATQTPSARQPTEQQGFVNQDAINRLGNAGVQVPGLGIGGRNQTPPLPSRTGTTSPAQQGPPANQLGELQARFARMNSGGNPSPAGSSVSNLAAGAVGGVGKKPPPPPPAKKTSLGGTSVQNSQSPETGDAPPPIPLSSKPRPG